MAKLKYKCFLLLRGLLRSQTKEHINSIYYALGHKTNVNKYQRISITQDAISISIINK